MSICEYHLRGLDKACIGCNKNRMKVLLISANTETINMPVLPIGMAAVALSAENAGHDVFSLNLLGEKDVFLSLESAFHKISPDVIGISVRNIDDQSMDSPQFLLDAVREYVEICRKMSDAPIVAGGAGYSIFPRAVLEYIGADYGIEGEGEEIFPLLLDFLSLRRNPLSIPGVYHRRSERENPPRFSRHIHSFPLPRPGPHLDMPYSLKKSELWFPYQTRRGCPMNCSYCSTPVIESSRIRSHHIESVIENMSRFAACGIDQFFFVDNIFNIPKGYAEDLCDAISDSGLNIKWRCIIYPWQIDETLAGKMARAGCTDVALGYESGSVPVLSKLNKKYGPDEVSDISRILNEMGIQQMGFLLLGGPGETRETVLESLDFSDGLPLDALNLTIGIRIYPRTPLAGIAVEEGVISASDNLLTPRFYLRPDLASWLPDYIETWAKDRPHCVL